MVEYLALAVFPAVMAFALFSDLLTFTIPNLLSVTLVAAYVALAAWLGVPLQDMGFHFAAGLVALVIAFALFEFRVIGGGDAKLASATLLWLGPELAMDYVALFSLIGGAFAVIILQLSWRDGGERASSLPLISRFADKTAIRIPYGVALGLAGVLLYPQSAMWRAAAGL